MLLRPFNHQRIYSKFKNLKYIIFLLNFFYNFFYIFLISLKVDKTHQIELEDINSTNIKKFVKTELNNNLVNTYLDKNFLKWRFLQSPELKNYIYVTYKKKYNAIIKIRNEKKFCQYLDLLIIDKYNEDADFIQFILKIMIWANKKKLSYVKMILSEENISNYLNKNIFNLSTKPKFAYFSKNTDDMQKLQNSNFSFQLFDTDFEFSN